MMKQQHTSVVRMETAKMRITIKNTSGLFDNEFCFEVTEGANWFALEGKIAKYGKDSLTIDANFQVGAYYKDELGNKYDGYIASENGIVSSTEEIVSGEYDFIEEDSLYD